ncbi:hypothetical protein G6F57_017399 [Rhizopus arrhizus]|nr:hypothetical protein G6F57_017399 [Rhizopus arrhizus]
MAPGAVIVHHAHRLHERVDGGGPPELPAQLLQRLGQGHGVLGGCGAQGGGRAGRRVEAPEERRKRALLFDHFQRACRVVDHRFDLAAMPHDAGVGQQGGDLLFTEARHLGRIEIREAAPERLALVQDGAPTEARLEPFQAKLFEQGAVIALRTAPFVVVIGHVFGGRIHPAAAGQAVGKFGFSS